MSEPTTGLTATHDYSATGVQLPADATLADIVAAVNGLKKAVGSVAGLTTAQESALTRLTEFFG